MHSPLREWRAAGAGVLVFLLLFQPALGLVVGAQKRAQRSAKQQTENQQIAHVLSRLTFGARPGDFERVKAMGVDAFIAAQLDPDAIDDAALDGKLKKLPTLNLATPVLIEQYTPPKPVVVPSPSPSISPSVVAQMPAEKTAEKMPAMQGEMTKDDEKAMAGRMPALPTAAPQAMASLAATPTPAPKPTPVPKNPQLVVTELQRAALLRAVYSDRQLNELLVDFWENHFSIFANKDEDRFLMTSFDRDIIRPFAFGRFRDLLGATAHSPAMLFYLDNWRSSVPRSYPATKDKPAGIDGGLNENYARELMELHTLGVDGGYTQKDVQEVARCFTGWTIQKPNEQGLFLYRPGLHDNGEKIVLGHRIPAGGGIADGERVLDILATHPSTARFIATKLARRFIADDPPQSVIDRATETFLKTDGSIRETLRAIVTAPEFFSLAAYRAKVRTPFEYLVASLRALNAETDADPALIDWCRRMGQQVFGRLTPDGYPDRAEPWLTPGALLERFNFANTLVTDKIKGTHVDMKRVLRDADLRDAQTVADRLEVVLLANDLSAQTRAVIDKVAREGSAKIAAAPPAVKDINYLSPPGKPNIAAKAPPYVAQMITMLLGAPEFQRR